jgi:hypothetical protein
VDTLTGSSGIQSTSSFGSPGLVRHVTVLSGASGISSTAVLASGEIARFEVVTGTSVVNAQSFDAGVFAHALSVADGHENSSEFGTGELHHELIGASFENTSEYDSGELTVTVFGKESLESISEFADPLDGILSVWITGQEGVPPTAELFDPGHVAFVLYGDDSVGIDSTSDLGSGQLGIGIFGLDGLENSSEVSPGSASHVLVGTAGVDSSVVLDAGLLGVAIGSVSGLANDSAFGTDGVLTVQVRGYSSFTTANEFGSGALHHGLHSDAGIDPANEFGTGVLSQTLVGGAWTTSTSAVNTGGVLSHGLFATTGLNSTAQFGIGQIESRFKVQLSGTGDFSVDWQKHIFASGLVFDTACGLSVNGLVIPYISPLDILPVDKRQHVSHLTQQFQNYFDQEDVRVRSLKHTIDHQLLNVAATSLERASFEVERRVRPAGASYVPLNIDSRGVYHQLYLPPDISDFKGIEANKESVWVVLKEYSDELQVPSTLALATDTEPIRFSAADTVLATLTEEASSFSTPTDMKIPGHLYLEVEGNADELALEVCVLGEEYPPLIWVNDKELNYEYVPVADAGIFRTSKTWSRIVSVVVKDMPAGVSIKLDHTRPHHNADVRGYTYDRFWNLHGGTIKELYYTGRYSEYQTINTYGTTGYTSIVLEPNTYGMFATDGRYLFYLDRREPVPDRRDQAVLTREPLWNLKVEHDLYNASTDYVVTLTPIPARNAVITQRWRYIVENPEGEKFVLLPSGALSPFTQTAGFRYGRPPEMQFPLDAYGTWTFSLECEGLNVGLSTDTAIYNKLQARPLFRGDISAHIPNVQGLMFDYKQQLWAWTGEYLLPLRFEYDSYVYDPDKRVIFFTDKYLEVRLF